MKKLLFAIVLMTATATFAAVSFKLGIAGYTYHKKSLDEALAAMKAVDVHCLCVKDFHLALDADDAALAAFRGKCAAAGVEILAEGPLYFKDENSARKLFEQAKKLGVGVVDVVPYELWDESAADTWGPNRIESDAALDILEKLVKEYDIRAAIHNHGPDTPDLYPTAESVWARIKDRDPRIGFCLDIGHERRAGRDPVESVRKFADRIYDVHLKNIRIDPARNLAMPGPRGELDIPAILRSLAEVGYAGVCHIEYERDFEDNALGLAESVGYYRGVMDTIKARAKMMPVPKGANALTAEEKSEGFELFFNGKDLPADKWVGVKDACASFPAKGWFVKDGCLTMRPQHFIKDDGTWGDLPPEDMKLGGGGDLVTVKKYRDFVFKFDFRMTECANSGVKYFYDEKTDGGTCEEYQILENGHPDSGKGRDGNRKTASLYDIIPAHADDVLKGPGEWNAGMIVSKGAHVEHWLNGVKVLEYERGGADFKASVKTSKYADWGKATDGTPRDWGENAEGRILLQDHSDSTVSFCNLKIKEL